MNYSSKLDVFNPYTGKLTASYNTWSKADIENLLQRVFLSKDSIIDNKTLKERCIIIDSLSKIVENFRYNLRDSIICEAGKTYNEAEREINRSLNSIYLFTRMSYTKLGYVYRVEDDFIGNSNFAFSIKTPIGIALSITPFSTPLNCMVHKAIAAFIVGIPIIIIPSPKAPGPAIIFEELLRKAGISKDWVSVVLPDSPESRDFLISSSLISAITLTGRFSTAKAVFLKASTFNILVESGNTTTVAIFQDAKRIDRIAKDIIVGAFSQAGQRCISIQKVFVHTDLFKNLKVELMMQCSKLVIGDPADINTDIGPVISYEHKEYVEKIITDIEKSGYSVSRFGDEDFLSVRPTIVWNLDINHVLMNTEIFAPIVCINECNNEDEILNNINKPLYGLQHGIYTNDISRIKKMVTKINSGGITVNFSPSNKYEHAPFGGINKSGNGKDGIEAELNFFQNNKFVVIGESL